MALSPSLSLLKGKTAATPAAPAAPAAAPAVAKPAPGKVNFSKKTETPPSAAPAAPAEAVEETVVADTSTQQEEETVVDVDKMSSVELDKLVKDNDIMVPETWAKMKVAEKRATLKAMFQETPEEGAQTEVEAVETVSATAAPSAKPGVPAVAKPPAKTTPAKAAKGVLGELVGPDAIADFAHLVENLKENDAIKLSETLSEETDLTYFKLGGVFALIQTQGWFAPHASFREWVEKERGQSYRIALFWIAIYNTLVEQKIPWDSVKSLGWTKLKVICPVIDAENVSQWVEVAEQSTVVSLSETVLNAQNEAKAAAVSGGEAQAPAQIASTQTPVSTKTFKVHPDQKTNIDKALEKAKTAANTTVDTVALEYICMDYMAGGTKKPGGKPGKVPSLAEQLKAAGIDDAFTAVGEAFPELTVNVEVPEEKAAAA